MPATEAMEAGVALMMTDCSPNMMWPIFPLQGAVGRSQHTPFGPLRTYMVRSRAMAYEIDRVNGTRDVLAQRMGQSKEWAAAHTWAKLKPTYRELFKSL